MHPNEEYFDPGFCLAFNLRKNKNNQILNPFNALCCHGVESSEVMTRLVLVLDEKTGLPVWYDIIPGNVCDISTTMNVVNDVADNLGITINSLVLDAGYVSKELIHAFHIGTAIPISACSGR